MGVNAVLREMIVSLQLPTARQDVLLSIMIIEGSLGLEIF